MVTRLAANPLGTSKQWSGWLKGLGSSAAFVEKIINVVGGLVTAVVIAVFIFQMIRISIALANAESPEHRAEVKKKLMWWILGIVLFITGTTITFALFNTIGKTIEVNNTSASNSLVYLQTWIKT